MLLLVTQRSVGSKSKKKKPKQSNKQKQQRNKIKQTKQLTKERMNKLNQININNPNEWTISGIYRFQTALSGVHGMYMYRSRLVPPAPGVDLTFHTIAIFLKIAARKNLSENVSRLFTLLHSVTGSRPRGVLWVRSTCWHSFSAIHVCMCVHPAARVTMAVI